MSCAPTFADSKKALPESFGINTTLISFAAFLAVPAADAGAVLPAADAVDVVLPLLQPAKVERIIAVASVIAINLRMIISSLKPIFLYLSCDNITYSFG
jgi:hypothetical protein